MEHIGRGISAKNANLVMATITLIISALLIYATYLATTGYSKMRSSTDNYIQWQRDASDLQVGSDIVSGGAAYGHLIKDFDKLFREADAALYRGKNNGGAGCEVCL